MRGPYHRCIRCDSGTKPLRAKTFYERGRHTTFYVCLACHAHLHKRAERIIGRKLSRHVDGAWEDLPPVPHTGADPELDARLAAEGQ